MELCMLTNSMQMFLRELQIRRFWTNTMQRNLCKISLDLCPVWLICVHEAALPIQVPMNHWRSVHTPILALEKGFAIKNIIMNRHEVGT